MKKIFYLLFLVTTMSTTTQCMKIEFFNIGERVCEAEKNMTWPKAMHILSKHKVFDQVIKVVEQKYAKFIHTDKPDFTKNIPDRFADLLDSQNSAIGNKVFSAITQSMNEYLFNQYFTENRQQSILYRTEGMPSHAFKVVGKDDRETFYISHASNNPDLYAAIEVFSQWYLERLRSLKCWMICNKMDLSLYQKQSSQVSNLIIRGILRDYLFACNIVLEQYYCNEKRHALNTFLYMWNNNKPATPQDFLVDFGINLTFGCYTEYADVPLGELLEERPNLKKVSKHPRVTHPKLYKLRVKIFEEALKIVFNKVVRTFES